MKDETKDLLYTLAKGIIDLLYENEELKAKNEDLQYYKQQYEKMCNFQVTAVQEKTKDIFVRAKLESELIKKGVNPDTIEEVE